MSPVWVLVALAAVTLAVTVAVAVAIVLAARGQRREIVPEVKLPGPWEKHRTPARTPAASGRELHEAFARTATLNGEGLQMQPGCPNACRDLLSGMADTLLGEAASAAVRGDDANARVLVWVEAYVRDARDSIDG